MKVKEIKKNMTITDNDCDLCKIHKYMCDAEYNIKCPVCGEDLRFIADDHLTPVGETNGGY